MLLECLFVSSLHQKYFRFYVQSCFGFVKLLKLLIIIILGVIMISRPTMACEGNCSGHGQCLNGSCYCMIQVFIFHDGHHHYYHDVHALILVPSTREASATTRTLRITSLSPQYSGEQRPVIKIIA